MTDSIPDEVLIERRGGVLIAKLNRPAKRNAINRALAEKLLAAVIELDEDPSLRAGVVASATPGMFCAGADLQALAAGEMTNPDGTSVLSFTRVAHAKPWVAAATGALLGGGLEIALACEMIVAGEGATIGLPEVKRGLVAAGGGVFRLRRAIPRAVAMEMVLTGAMISAQRAYDLGLVNRVVPDAEVLEEAVRLALAVVPCAPGSVRESLVIMNQSPEVTEEALWEITSAAQTRLKTHPDFKEGVAAFMEKRSPVWTGR